MLRTLQVLLRRIPARNLERLRLQNLQPSPRLSLLPRARAAKAGAKGVGKEENFEKLKKVKSLQKL